MPKALEGSQAIAQAVALCRPQVISAYPITPQTHIVENISKLVADGKFVCEFVSVESEFSAASVALGAAMAGSRAYTASASQGIMLMTEVLYNIAGTRVPLVMTCANRAISAPLSIWNDQQDSMSVRDAGWIQLYVGDNQEAVDTTIQAYRIAERCELPVMVCVDGFTLTHTLEPLEIPTQAEVDGYLPPYHFARKLDPRHPTSVGTLVSPDFYTEARYSHHRALEKALEEIQSADRDWAAVTGRNYGGLLQCEGPAEAEIGVLALGAICGTLATAREDEDLPVRLIRLRSFRPFPFEALKAACAGLKKLVVLDRAISPGFGGIVGAEVRSALADMPDRPQIFNYTLGLGGRDIPITTLSAILKRIEEKPDEQYALFDLEVGRLPEEDQ